MYALIKARVKVQNTNNLQQFVYNLEQQINSTRYTNELSIKYEYAYALDKVGKNKEALKIIYEALKLAPESLILQMTAAEIETNCNMYKEAQMRLERQLDFHADSESLQLQYISLLIRTSQAQEANRKLNELQNIHSPDLHFYKYRREAEGMLNNQIGVYEANAEWFFLAGQFPKALAQLNYALEAPPTHSNLS